MDPLALLREFCTSKKLESVVRNGTRIDFGDLYSFESSTPTRFRSRGGGYYTLGTVFFFLKNKMAPYGQYFQNAKKENWDTVALVDKKNLIEYMEGKADSCPQIDAAMSNLPVAAGVKRVATEGEDAIQQSDKRKIQKLDTLHKGQEDTASTVRSENPDQWTIEQIYAQEKETFDPVKAMRVDVDFSYVLKFASELLSERVPRENKTSATMKQPRTFLRPIILVPHGMTAILSMYNAKEFLEKGKYIFPEEVYTTNRTREVRTLVARSFERETPVNYMVSEKLPHKDDEATWKRVVAVVVSGKAHQFKEYPFEGCDKGDVYDLLHNHVQGFYFQYHDDNFNESEAATWKVKVLTVHRHHRHGDNLLMQQFWGQVDRFIEEKKLDRVFKY